MAQKMSLHIMLLLMWWCSRLYGPGPRPFVLPTWRPWRRRVPSCPLASAAWASILRPRPAGPPWRRGPEHRGCTASEPPTGVAVDRATPEALAEAVLELLEDAGGRRRARPPGAARGGGGVLHRGVPGEVRRAVLAAAPRRGLERPAPDDPGGGPVLRVLVARSIVVFRYGALH